MQQPVLTLSGVPAAFVEVVATMLRRAARRARLRAVAAVAWLRSRTPEQVLWVFLAMILLVYLAVLFTASTSTGRGGR